MIYDNIKSIAAKKKISIAALEKKAGLSNGTIGKWTDSMPNVDSLLKVAKALDVDMNVLLKGRR